MTGAADDVLGAAAGAVVLAAWVAVTLGTSVLAITRRDVYATSPTAMNRRLATPAT